MSQQATRHGRGQRIVPFRGIAICVLAVPKVRHEEVARPLARRELDGAARLVAVLVELPLPGAPKQPARGMPLLWAHLVGEEWPAFGPLERSQLGSQHLPWQHPHALVWIAQLNVSARAIGEIVCLDAGRHA